MPEIRNYTVILWPQRMVQMRMPEMIRDHYRYIDQAVEEKPPGA